MKPFDNYPNGGRSLCEPLLGDNCRYSYGHVVVYYCGTDCVYCGADVAKDYRAWLSLSVDHVIPQNKLRDNYNEKWIYDLSNQVTCCRACNEFLNRFPVNSPPPQTLSEFHDLRDQVFADKRELARKRHAEEQAWHKTWRAGAAPPMGAATKADESGNK